MSKATLKKALNEMDRDSLSEIICELYDARPEAKEYLEFWINPDADKELDKYRQKIFKQFFISGSKPRKSPVFKEIKTCIKYFTTLCIDHEKTADLMLYTLDLYQLWLSERKRIMSHQTRVERFINDTAAYIESHNLEDRYELRFNRIREEMSELFKRGEEPLRQRWKHWW